MKKLLLSALAALMTVSMARADALPYSQTFDSQADFGSLTLYHNSSDTRDWDYSSSAARFYPGTRYNAYDAWFFLPELNLEAGTQYVVTFDTKISSSGSSNYKNISVNIGSDATPDSQKELWAQEIQSNSYATKKVSFSVDASGAYRLGFRTNASSGSINDILVDNIKVQAYVELPGAATDITATAGEKGTLEVTLSWTNPAVNDGGTALGSLSGVVIKRTDSSWVSMSSATEIASVTDGVAVGETSTFTDTTIPASGNYYYYIVPFNDNGSCPATISAVKTGYVGPDTGLSATQNAVAAAVENNEKAITLTWDAPKGTNGGYVDPSTITWKITRKGPQTVVLEEAWTGEVPYNYVDETITEIGAYSYTVQYVVDGKTESTGATSNKVVTGGTASLPYSQPFSDSNSLDLFGNFTGSASTTKWNKPTYNNFVQVAQTSGTMDAWLVTPPFELKAGTYYDLSFDTSSSSTKPKDFEVMLGQAPTAEALTTSLFDETLELSSTAKTNSVRFKADADGRYYIGFHAKGAASAGYLRLTNINLSEVIVAPVAATGLSAKANADGELKVDLAWTNPSTDVLGNELSVISKIEVLRGSEVIKTYSNATPGEAMKLVDEVEAPGKYIYSVVAYLGENAGEAATVTSDKVGGAMSLPYTADYSTADAFADWTMPALASGDKWTYNSTYQRLETPDKDGLWLFTPEFKGKKGVVTVTLTGARRSTYSETVNVALYKTADPAAEAQSEVKTFTFDSTSQTDAEFSFEVAEAGVYTIGIYRPKSGWNLYLYGTVIEQTSAVIDTAPLAATDLVVAGDKDNDTLVHLSWVNPSKMEGGDNLAEITKVEILRDEAVVATLTEGLTPGEAAAYDDTVDAAGVFTYSIVVYNGEDASEAVSAKSPFIGGGFPLPYSATLSSAETVEYWTLPANASGKTWKYETSSANPHRTGLVASSNDVKAYTLPFKARKGEVTVTFGAASYNYNYRETIKVGLFGKAEFDAEPIGEWQSKEVESGSYAEDVTMTFDVPEDGTYYIGFYIETSRMYFYISSISIEQPVEETITVLWDNTEAQYMRPVVEIDGKDIEMSSYIEPEMAAIMAKEEIKASDIYKAEIPAGTASVIFKDGDNATSPTFVAENPQHNWIYSLDGGKEFDEGEISGIEGVEADGNDTVRYFDLRGIETSTPRHGNLYIMVRGGKATKQIVK